MEAEESALTLTKHFQDQIGLKGQIYNLFDYVPLAQIKKQLRNTKKSTKFLPLFKDDCNNKASKCSEQPSSQNTSEKSKDLNLLKILQNTKQKKSRSSGSSHSSNSQKYEFYSFNYDPVLAFHQTPNFKISLQSPFKKFIQTNIDKILELSQILPTKQKVKQVHLKANPLEFKQRPALFFMGLALNMKNKGYFKEALFFYELASFTEPFNSKNWGEYVDLLKKIGMWRKAAIVAKTGFLFNPTSTLSEDYLLCGDKAGLPTYELRGLLGSLSDPLKFEKVIIQSARLELKNRKTWRGFLLLFKYLLKQDFKSNLFQSITLVSSVLSYFGYTELLMQILQRAINQKLCKYETFSLFLQETFRSKGGQNIQWDLKFLEDKINNMAAEPRYRVYLDLADTSQDEPQQCRKYYRQALKTANRYCTQEANRRRAFRHIYIKIVSTFVIEPDNRILQLFPKDDHFRFLVNKVRFVRGEPLQQFHFSDWKYYLHFCLSKNLQILKNCYKSCQQGRVLAEYIHAIRLKRKPLAVLKLWRDKIEQSPKSGELWCEGGRIFIELKQYSNARKCLLAAIHFTPQYGDSFLELLKVLLIENNFIELNQLRKNFFVSDPFYGNVFSFLRLSKIKQSPVKLSLKQTLNDFSQIWDKGRECIEKDIYESNVNNYRKLSQDSESQMSDGKVILTACSEYNRQFQKPSDPKERQRLFLSYELIENKFSR